MNQLRYVLKLNKARKAFATILCHLEDDEGSFGRDAAMDICREMLVELNAPESGERATHTGRKVGRHG